MENDIIVLNDRDFLIIERVNYNENSYLYVIATDRSNDITVLEEYINNNKKYVKSVTDSDLIDKVFLLVGEKYKEKIYKEV